MKNKRLETINNFINNNNNDFEKLFSYISDLDEKIKIKIYKNILEKIPKNYTREDLLLIITKEFLLNGINNCIEGTYTVLYKPSKYSDIKTNRIISLIYELIDDELYIYDWKIHKEHQIKYKVTEINGIKIKELIDFIDKNNELSKSDICKILMNKQLVKLINKIDDYKITIILDGKEQTISLENDYFELEMFEKKHTTAKVLNKDNFRKNENFKETNDNKLNYAYDSSNKLLKVLLGLSKSEEDKKLFSEILIRQEELYDINFGTEYYLDWMYISSFFLFYESSLTNLPQYIYDNIALSLKNNFKCFFLDEFNEEIDVLYDDFSNYGSNDYIIKKIFSSNSKIIDYEKLVAVIRNSFGHSSYEIIDENYVRIYGYNDQTGEQNLNLKLEKRLVISIMSKLMEFDNLNNLFPCCCINGYFGELIHEYKSLETKEEIIKFLNNMVVLNLQDLNFIKSNNGEHINLDNGYSFAIETLKPNLLEGSINEKNYILHLLKLKLDKYINYTIKEENIDINYVTKKIEQLGEDFYKHSLSNQFIIINEIIREQKLSEKGIASIIFEVIGYGDKINQEKSSGSIVDIIDQTSVGYIHYNKYIETALISYLNSIFLYGYNENYHLDTSDMDIGNKMYINFIEKDRETIKNNYIKEKSQLERQKINIEAKAIPKIKKSLNKVENNEYYRKNKSDEEIKQEIEIYTKLLIEKETEIEILTEKINVIKNSRFLDNMVKSRLNQEILDHIRNSLAHRYISFPNVFNFNDIGNTVIRIEDYNKKQNNKKTFEGTILLKNLLIEINNEKFLISIFDNLASDENKKEKN